MLHPLRNGYRLRECQFRTGVQLWSCWCYEDDAYAALNFIRFLS